MQQQRVVCVFPETKEGKLVYESLHRAATQLKYAVERIPFEKLDFGETDTLDKFHSSSVAVADVTDRTFQAKIFYHLGLRESFEMKQNVVTYLDHDQSHSNDKTSILDAPYVPLNTSIAAYTYLPYYLDKDGSCFYMDVPPNGDGKVNPNIKSVILEKKFNSVLRDMQVQSRKQHKEQFLRQLRKARDNLKGEELEQELSSLQGWIKEDPRLFTADILLSLLLSYRDIQAYNKMVKLVELLPHHDQILKAPIQVQYAFALNRRNTDGDRDKALIVLEKILENKENHEPDTLCLCGRIYKDKFVESGHTNSESREKAIYWYRKGFEVQPNEYAGINLATLLVISGKRFESDSELRNIAMTLNILIGRKGSIQSQTDYWVIATYFEISVLAEDYQKACEAANCMFRLKPPLWYLKSTVNNIQLINQFRLINSDSSSKKEEKLFSFWMEFFIEATKETFDNTQFPILLYEPNSNSQISNDFVYIPSSIAFHEANSNSEAKIEIWYYIPLEDEELPSEWEYDISSVRNVSINKRDKRGLFLYVLDKYSEDFQIYFSSDVQCSRAFQLISQLSSNVDSSKEAILTRHMTVDDDDMIEYEYEYNDKKERVVLGKGSFGTVYSAIDLITKKKLAVKEIPEKTTGEFQSIEEEIQLHRHLQHDNIVQYIGAYSEDGIFRIFMEQVPGGSLSQLLKYNWGPLLNDEGTIRHYTKQILKGLSYLHDQRIVHRDIKGDNVLVNTYSGQVKISDFGTSKRLAGLHVQTVSFKGTFQFMAPEVISGGQRGYGPPADVWSLGCTVIEMATGKPPFYELGQPELAVFKVGKFKEHPNIPPELSSNLQSFLLRCFEPDQQKRATVKELLEHPFISRKLKKVNIPEAPPDFMRSKSMFPQSTPEKNDTEKKATAATTFQRPTLSLDNVKEISIDGDVVATSSTSSSDKVFSWVEHNIKNQKLLNNVISEDSDKICKEVLSQLKDRGLNVYITKENLQVLLECIILYNKNGDEHAMMNELESLSGSCKENSTLRNEVVQALFLIPTEVNNAHKRHGVPPHCMFAIDNIVRIAINFAVNTVSPDLTLKFSGEDSVDLIRSSSRVFSTFSNNNTEDFGSEDIRHHFKGRSDEISSLIQELTKLKDEMKQLVEVSLDCHQLELRLLQHPQAGLLVVHLQLLLHNSYLSLLHVYYCYI
jgi:mitogen-activated protein kinase kinase kinase 5